MEFLEQNDNYSLINLSKEDLKSLLNMIKSSCLPERRHWNSVRQKIEKII